MRQVRVTNVQGRNVFADGRWLISIGNRTVRPGDIVWTDGRCVYGNQAEGGMDCVPIVPVPAGIPIFYRDGRHGYFSKGALHGAGSGKEYPRMLNDQKEYRFFDSYEILDAEYDDEGNLYTLEGGSVGYNFQIMDYVRAGACRLARNGETLVKFDLLPYLKRQLQKAQADADSLIGPVAGDNPGASSRTEFAQCGMANGKVDKNGNYVVVLDTLTDAQHEEWAYYTIEYPWPLGGADTYIMQSFGRASYQQRSLLTATGEQVYMEGKWTSTAVYGETSSYQNSQWDAPAGSIRLPLQDGYYCIFGGKVNMHEPSSGGDYSASIYNANGKFILSGLFNPFMNLAICEAGPGQYLLSTGFELYLYTDGVPTKLDDSIGNLRLRKMTNLSRWKKERG